MGSTTKFLFFTNNDSLTSSVYKIIYVFSIFLKGFFFLKSLKLIIILKLIENSSHTKSKLEPIGKIEVSTKTLSPNPQNFELMSFLSLSLSLSRTFKFKMSKWGKHEFKNP